MDETVYDFQFNVTTDRYQKLVYRHEAEDSPNKVIISKKILTTKEELPGAHLEVRTVTEEIGEDGTGIKKEGDLVESWISADTPHEIEYLKPGEYVLIETRAPEGFLEADRVYFMVKENMTVDEIPTVEMFDDDTKVEIRKVDSETKEPIPGVRLQLLREEDKELVKEWITDETGSISLTGLPAGNYLVQEMEPREGYQLPREPFRLTVTKDYKVQTFVLDNQKIEISIEKRDEETREFVSGAVLRLTDADGTIAAEWTTSDGPKVIKGLKAGEYLLEEIRAREGYLLLKEPVKILITNEAGVQTFPITNQKLQVNIRKTDKENGAMLTGAKLRLIRNTDQKIIREWESRETAEVFQGLLPGSYTLKELSAPDTYAVAKELEFEVKDTEAKQEITLENEKITVEFTKTDRMTGEIVEGAMLQLICGAGTSEETIVREWTSGKEAFTIRGITAGIYTIREKKAPEGYVTMQDMVIEILPDQAVQNFKIQNQPIQAEIEKTNGDTGKLLGGALLQFVRNSDGAVIREWVSKENEPETFVKLPAGTYTVREIKSPSGFKKMDPQEIEIRDVEGIQEFTVKNYKIRHSGGGGGSSDKPKPEGAYMELYKVDGTTGEKLAGAKITVYRPDGSVYFEGVTDLSGMVQFKKPESGTYSFRETECLDGYYLNGTVYQFTVKADGSVEGEDTIPNYKKTTVTISKEDVTTSEELPGAEIEITDRNGNVIFTGTSDENGKVYFEAPEPGEYQFREIVAPDGYEINETIFCFTVFEDGTIIGDCTVTDRKHYGRITAVYETERKGDGDLTIGELLHVPKTGDSSKILRLFGMWLASVSGLAAFLLCKRKQKKKDCFLPGILILAVVLVLWNSAITARAAQPEEILENICEEHQYTTDNPDSDDAKKLFEKEIERDGISYRLSEIRTEVVKEEAGSGKDGMEIASSPFLKEKAEENKPKERVEKNGDAYVLVDSYLEKTVIPAHEEKIEETVIYEAVEAKDVIPSNIQVTIMDEATGQKMEGTAKISGQQFGEKRWEDTFSFPVTFHEYGLDGYWLGENIFYLEGDVPDFHGYEKELLTLIEASEEDYQIEAAAWDGEAYEDSSGILCRNAVVTGKKLVSDCTVVYEGSTIFPEEMGMRYVATYEKEGGSQLTEHLYTMKATGVYVPKQGNATVLAAVAVGVAGAGAGAGAYVYSKKKMILKSSENTKETMR